jgi:hypothetical protein
MTMKIFLSESDIRAATEFSEKQDTSFYATRNQTNATKRTLDAKIGKLGEFAVYRLLLPTLPNLSPPDCAIYEAKHKSWAFDLVAKDYNIHVKSQDVRQSERYGMSWLFQFGDPSSRRGYDKEIFDKITPNQVIAFTTIDTSTNTAEVKAVVRLELLHEHNLFGEAKLPQLRVANKKAVYFSELEKFSEQFLFVR